MKKPAEFSTDQLDQEYHDLSLALTNKPGVEIPLSLHCRVCSRFLEVKKELLIRALQTSRA